jgi:hypothetical protein
MDQPHVSNSRNSFITTSAAHPLRILSFDNVLNADELKYIQNGKMMIHSFFIFMIKLTFFFC